MTIKTPAAPVRYGWYQPHKPVREDGMLFNHLTGEFYRPAVRVKQDFKDECDINNIIKSFQLTGQISHISAKAKMGAFLDLPDEADFHASMNILAKASEAFSALPAKIRDRFGNDPAQFLAFVSDPANGAELIELGIRERPPRASEPPQAPGGAGGTPPAPTPAPAPAAAPGGSNSTP